MSAEATSVTSTVEARALPNTVVFSFVKGLAAELSQGQVELPSVPEIVVRLQQTMSDENVTNDIVVRVIGSEPMLASKLLADRSKDIVDLMQHSSLVFKEVERRKDAIHRLLVNARQLAIQLRGVATDNQTQITPALKQVDGLLSLLNSKDKELKATLDALGPYASILGNIIGTGPWFDAYAVNLAAIPTGEFLPGPPD